MLVPDLVALFESTFTRPEMAARERGVTRQAVDAGIKSKSLNSVNILGNVYIVRDESYEMWLRRGK